MTVIYRPRLNARLVIWMMRIDEEHKDVLLSDGDLNLVTVGR